MPFDSMELGEGGGMTGARVGYYGVGGKERNPWLEADSIALLVLVIDVHHVAYPVDPCERSAILFPVGHRCVRYASSSVLS